MATNLREVQWSDLQRDPKSVAALADEGDVRVKRRDGADLILTRADRLGQTSEGAIAAARAFRRLLVDLDPDTVGEAFIDEFPWIRVLPPAEITAFVRDFARSSLASAELQQWEVLAQVLREWKATAAIYADPELSQRLMAPIAEDHGSIPSPMDDEE